MPQEKIGTMAGEDYFVGTATATAPGTIASDSSNPNANYNSTTGKYSLPIIVNPNSPVSSSTVFRQGVDNLGNQITGTAAKPPLVPSIYDTTPLIDAKAESAKLIEQRQKQLEARRDAELQRITSEFDSADRTLKEAQRKETGSSSMGLARIGGFDSASGQALLLNLEQQHRNEQQALVSKRQAAVQLAQTAFEDKDFELAQLQLKDAREVDKLVYEREKDFADYTLKLRENMRQDMEFQYKMGEEERKQGTEFRDFARENFVQQPFFEFGGALIETATGRMIKSKDEAIAAGVAEDFSNVQVVKPTKKYSSGVIGEYEKYLEDVEKGLSPFMSFDQFQTLDANRKAKIAKAGATTILDTTREYDLRVKQSAAKVRELKAQNYSWQQIADYMTSVGIDPGAEEVDDALNRAFKSDDEYKAWKADQAKIKRGVTAVNTYKNKDNKTVVEYSDGSTQVIN